MQKIAIIGPGSMDLATELGELHPGYVFIGLADADSIVVEAPIRPVHDYGAIAMSHSFAFDYQPDSEARAWLTEQLLSGERYTIEPIMRHDNGLLCSASYWFEGKEAAGRAQRPRHRSEFTKSRPTAKARKAARRRAKAGRKASR